MLAAIHTPLNIMEQSRLYLVIYIGSLPAVFKVATFSDLILRIVFAFLLSPGMSYRGICSAWHVGWIVGTALSIACFASGQRKAARTDI